MRNVDWKWLGMLCCIEAMLTKDGLKMASYPLLYRTYKERGLWDNVPINPAPAQKTCSHVPTLRPMRRTIELRAKSPPPPDFAVLGRTLCEASLAPARVGHQGVEAAFVSRRTAAPLLYLKLLPNEQC